jgi:hypothetical protein
MEKKQTAVEWLWLKIQSDEKAHMMDYSEALQKEQKQMFDFAKAFYRYASGPDSGAVYDEDIQRFCDKHWTK